MIVHPIPPVFDGQSEILILGSFPSVKSREAGFFYGHQIILIKAGWKTFHYGVFQQICYNSC